MSNIQPFHVAFPVSDLKVTRNFYVNKLECTEGRSSPSWIDFNLFGHQIVAHLSPNEVNDVEKSEVDGKMVPVRHFGVILEWDQWYVFANMLQSKTIEFIIEPYIRFKGESGEQATMFFLDPSGNALEFKSFKNKSHIFKK
jgi:extradiol dioxygenase family protein